MASGSCTAALRHVVSRQPSRLRPIQRRWARVHDVRFQDVRYLATHNTQERILAKYRDQLERKAKEEGHPSVDSLKEAYKDKIDTLRKKAIVPGATGPLNPSSSSSSSSSSSNSDPSQFLPKSPSPPPPPSIPKPVPAIKPLSSYLDLAKVSALPASEIPALWRLRHASSPTSLSFTLPADTWAAIAATARKHPQFILPLPRERSSSSSAASAAVEPDPIEIHFLQFSFPTPDAATLLFTHLAEYKLRGEFAAPHTTVTFHTELARSHGLVLGQGSVLEGRGVGVEEARWLLMCLQKFYGLQGERERGGRGRRLLEMFSEGDGGFRVEDLVDEVERV